MFTPLKMINDIGIGSEWSVTSRLPVSQNFFFRTPEQKKVPSQGRIYSIYMNEDIAPAALEFSVP
jgi:hypothetical protein